MRKMRLNGSFFLSLAINLLFHWEWSVPAWILLILHVSIGIPIKWFRIALGIWIGVILLWQIIAGRFCSWAAKCGNTPAPPKKNVNPYSVGKTDENEKK